MRIQTSATFCGVSNRLLPWLITIGTLMTIIGSIWGRAFTSVGYALEEGGCILYVYLLAAVLLIGVYAAFTVLTLGAGRLWRQSTRGAWMVVDAHLITELGLLVLYLGWLSLYGVIARRETAFYGSALLTAMGVVLLPAIGYAVAWPNTRHPGATPSCR